jgi:hypothetical protein
MIIAPKMYEVYFDNLHPSEICSKVFVYGLKKRDLIPGFRIQTVEEFCALFIHLTGLKTNELHFQCSVHRNVCRESINSRLKLQNKIF